MLSYHWSKALILSLFAKLDDIFYGKRSVSNNKFLSVVISNKSEGESLLVALFHVVLENTGNLLFLVQSVRVNCLHRNYVVKRLLLLNSVLK